MPPDTTTCEKAAPRPAGFDDPEVTLVEGIADQIGTALERDQLSAEIMHLRSALHEGHRWNTFLNREALAIVETADGTPFYLNLHQRRDVAEGKTVTFLEFCLFHLHAVELGAVGGAEILDVVTVGSALDGGVVRGNRRAGGCIVMRSFGLQSAQSCAFSLGTVDAGWRVASSPSRVGTCARVPEARRL